MKVKIIKAEKSKWYYKLIGKVRTAKCITDFGIGKTKTYVMRNYRTLLRTIPIEDCDIYIEGNK
jgi:hypothetical protein